MGVKVSRWLGAAILLVAPLIVLVATPVAALDVVYNEQRSFSGLTIPIRGNLTVGPSGDVTFLDSQIFFNSTQAGERQLWVQPGGRLRLQRTIVAGDPAPFKMRIEGTLILEESEVRPVHSLLVGGNPSLAARMYGNGTRLNVTSSLLIDRGVANVSFTDARVELSGPQGDYRINATEVSAKRTIITITHQGLSLTKGARLNLDSATFTGKAYGLRCTDSDAFILRTTITSNQGYALDAVNCDVELRSSTITSQNADAVRIREGTLAGNFSFIQAPKGNGILLERVISSLKDFNSTALLDAFTVAGRTGTLSAVKLDATSKTRNAFVCAGASGVTILGGKWLGDASGGVGENCGGQYRQIDITGTKANAVRWDGAPGALSTFENNKILKTLGPAFLMTGPAMVGLVDANTLPRVVEWSKPANGVELGNPLTEAPLVTACFHDQDNDDVVDAAEGVYLQVKPCGANSLTGGDVRLSGPATKAVPARLGVADTVELNAATETLPTGSRYAFTNLDSNGVHGFSDYVYIDLGGDGSVTPGDLRISDTGAGRGFTRVAAGDGDANAAFALLPLPNEIGAERFQDVDKNGLWGPLEPLYIDSHDAANVSSGDLRLWNANRAYAASTHVLPPAAGAKALVHNVTYAGPAQCVLCLDGGAYAANDLRATGEGTGIKATKATLTLSGGNLTGMKQPLNLTDTAATSFNTALKPSAHALLRSTLEAKFDFRPLVRFKNAAPVPGARVEIRDPTNALLSTGTTDAQGLSPGFVVRSYQQTDTTTGTPQSLKVKVEFKGVAQELTLSTLAFPFYVTVRDDAPPSDLKTLRATGEPNRQRVALAWDASTDNLLPPSYLVELALPTGVKHIVKAGVRTNYTGERVATTAATSHAFDLPGEGVYEATVRAIDASGNLGKGMTVGVTWDDTKPALTLTPNGIKGNDGWWRGNLTVRLDAQDNVSFIQTSRLDLDGVRAANAQAPLLVDIDGQHEVQAAAVDATGNTATATLNLRLDSQAPTVPALSTDRTIFSDPARVPFHWLGEPTDRLSGVLELRLMRDNGSGNVETVDRFLPPFPTETKVDLKTGAATYYLVAVDRAGNQAESPPLRIVVDRVAPVLEPLSTRQFPAGARLTFTFTDESDVTTLLGYVDGVLWETNASRQITLEGIGKGAHNVRLVATDEAGNVQDISIDVQVGSKSSPGAGLALVLGGLLMAGYIRRKGRPCQERTQSN